MSDYGWLQEVVRVPRTTALTVAASISDTELVVDSAGDMDPDGGTLELNGVQLDYTSLVWGETEDDSDTIVLAAPLAAAADVDDDVAPVSGGLAQEDWWARVDMGGGEAVDVPLRYGQRSMWAEGQYDPPVKVEVADDLSRIIDADGRPASVGSRTEAWNEDEWEAAGDDTDSPGILTFLPKPHSLTVEQNGVRLRNNEFTIVDRIATPLADQTIIRAGDRFTAYYDRDPAAEVVGVGDNPDVSSSLYDEAVLAEPSLLGYWRLAEASGLVMVDSSGNGHDGVYSADVELGAAAILTSDPDTSAHFPNLGAPRGVVPHGSWMNVPTLSVEAWLDIDAVSSGIQYIVNRDTQGRAWELNAESGGNVRFSKIASGTVASIGTADVDDTNRHYVVATYDGANIKIYLDGALIQTTAATGDPSATADLAIGGTYAGDSTWWAPYYFKGKLSKVAMYSGAQSAAAILNRWTIGSTGAP